MKTNSKGIAVIPILIVLVLILIATPFAVKLVQQNQNQANRAATETACTALGNTDCFQTPCCTGLTCQQGMCINSTCTHVTDATVTTFTPTLGCDVINSGPTPGPGTDTKGVVTANIVCSDGYKATISPAPVAVVTTDISITPAPTAPNTPGLSITPAPSATPSSPSDTPVPQGPACVASDVLKQQADALCHNHYHCPVPTPSATPTPNTANVTAPTEPGKNPSCAQTCSGKTLKDCTPPLSDGTPNTADCNRVGRFAPCGGDEYCCSTLNGNWTSSMTKCPSYVADKASITNYNFPYCDNLGHFYANLIGSATVPNYHQFWITLTDVKANKTITIAKELASNIGSTTEINYPLSGTVVDLNGVNPIVLIGDGSHQYLFKIYDGITNKDGSLNFSKTLSSNTLSTKCSLLPVVTPIPGVTRTTTPSPSPTPTQTLSNGTVPFNPGVNNLCAQTCSGRVLKDCTPPLANGNSNQNSCDTTGKAAPCGGEEYCCPAAGGNWTSAMTKCPGFKPDSASLNAPTYPGCNSSGQFTADISGTAVINNYHKYWIALTDVKANKNIIVAGIGTTALTGSTPIGSVLPGSVNSFNGTSSISLVGDNRQYVYKIYDGITNKDGTPNITKLLAQTTLNVKCTSIVPTPTAGPITPTPTGVNGSAPLNPGINAACAQICSGKVLKDCTPPNTDGTFNQNTCTTKGTFAPCGGKMYCCPAANSNYTASMSKCPTFVPDKATITLLNYPYCNSQNQFYANIGGAITVNNYHKYWLTLTDTKTKTTITIAKVSVGITGVTQLNYSLSGTVKDTAGANPMPLVGDGRQYQFKIYDGITNKDGTLNYSNMLTSIAMTPKCGSLSTVTPTPTPPNTTTAYFDGCQLEVGSSASAFTTEATNLAPNPSFENDIASTSPYTVPDKVPSGWTQAGTGTVSQTTVDSHDGAVSAIIKNPDGLSKIYAYFSHNLTIGTTYTFSCWVKSNTTAAGINNPIASQFPGSHVTSDQLNRWVQMVDVFVATAGTTQAEFQIGIDKYGPAAPSPTPTGFNVSAPFNPGTNLVCKETCSGKTLSDCTPPLNNGNPNQTTCNLAGQAAPCGGKEYCCPTAGSNWTSTMTKCPTYKADSVSIFTANYTSCTTGGLFYGNINGSAYLDNYHKFWITITDVKAKKTLTVAGIGTTAFGPISYSYPLTPSVYDLAHKNTFFLIGDGRAYTFTAYDGITNKDGTPNLTKKLSSATFSTQCKNLPVGSPACTQCSGHPTWKSLGDADCSGSTNINDASIWRSEFIAGGLGTQVSNTWQSDFDCDGKVTLNDISIWRTIFTKSLTQ